MAAISSSSCRPQKRLYQPPAIRESSSIPHRDRDTPPTQNSQLSCNNYSSSSNTRHPKAHEFSASSELKRHGRGQMKWWSPKNDDQQKTFETYKADIKAALTISKRGTNVLKAYDELVDAFDGEIKYKDLGFNTFGEFLFHCDDILEVRTDRRRVFGYYIFLRGQADDDMQHVQDLVEETPNKSRIRGFKATHRNTKHVSSEVLLHVRDSHRESLSLKEVQNRNYRNVSSSCRGSRDRVRGKTGGQSSRGGRVGGKRGSKLNINASTFTPGMNGVPCLKPYNPVVSLSNPAPVNPGNTSNSDSGRATGTDSGNTDTRSDSVQPAFAKVTSWLNGPDNNRETGTTRGAISETMASANQGLRGLAVSQIILDDTDSIDSEMDAEAGWTWRQNPVSAKVNLMGTKFLEKDDTKVVTTSTSTLKPTVSEVSTVCSNSGRGPSTMSTSAPAVCTVDTTATAASHLILKNTVTIAANVESKPSVDLGPLPWRQMKLPKTENFKGKLLGVDSYGFVFFQVNIPAINDGFDALKSSLQAFYNLPEHLDRYRINPAELKSGLMVVAYMQEASTFIRANIFETDLENNLCVVIDLEERDFHNVDPKDIYQIHQKFRIRCPRAVICTLAGLEPYMMTEEISDAFEVTPLLNSTEIKVTLLGYSEEVKVPCVKMTIRDSDGMEVDVVDSIKSHGSQFLKEITTWQDHQCRSNLQTNWMKILEEINYLPASC